MNALLTECQRLIEFYEMDEGLGAMRLQTAHFAPGLTLRIAVEWMGANPADLSLTMSRGFFEVAMDPKMLEAQMKAWQPGAMSFQTLYANLQRGEIARAERPHDIEQGLVKEEGGGVVAICPQQAAEKVQNNPRQGQNRAFFCAFSWS